MKRLAHSASRLAKYLLRATRRELLSRATRGSRRQIADNSGEVAALRRELARARGESGDYFADSPMFFVVGQQKSGTTWLMRMLDAHPEILCKGEGRFFDGGWRQESLAEGSDRPPSSLYNAMLGDEFLRLWIERSVWSRDDDTGEHLDNLTRMATDYFMRGELAKSGKKMAGDKSPLLTPETVAEISKITPGSKVVHIIRDGRDSAVSAMHHTWNFGERKNAKMLARREAYLKRGGSPAQSGESMFTGRMLEKLASDWSDRVGRAIHDGPALLGANYAEVRYENLLENPEEEIERLLDFLGASSSREAVSRCVESASFQKLSKGRERGEEDAASFFRKGVAGDWRSVFTENDKTIFKREAGELLVKLGYEQDERW